MVRRNNHLKMARYHQHLHELLEMDLSPLDYMMKMFPEFKEREQMRKVSRNLGRGEVGGGSQDRPLVSSLVSAVATARAGGEGMAGAGGTCWPRR